MLCNAGIDAASIKFAYPAFGKSGALESTDQAADRALVEAHSFGEVLHPHFPVVRGGTRCEGEELREAEPELAVQRSRDHAIDLCVQSDQSRPSDAGGRQVQR